MRTEKLRLRGNTAIPGPKQVPRARLLVWTRKQLWHRPSAGLASSSLFRRRPPAHYWVFCAHPAYAFFFGQWLGVFGDCLRICIQSPKDTTEGMELLFVSWLIWHSSTGFMVQSVLFHCCIYLYWLASEFYGLLTIEYYPCTSLKYWGVGKEERPFQITFGLNSGPGGSPVTTESPSLAL